MGKLALYAGSAVAGIVIGALIGKAVNMSVANDKAAKKAVAWFGISYKEALVRVKQFRKRANKEMHKTGSDSFSMNFDDFLNLPVNV
jgi:hypothetical protein